MSEKDKVRKKRADEKKNTQLRSPTAQTGYENIAYN